MMKLKPFLLMLCLLLAACSTNNQQIDKKTVGLLPTEVQPNLVRVAEFDGVQVTGVTISKSGRMFANFPRWRDNIPYSVVEVGKDGSHKAYPNQEWNNWKNKPVKDHFTCVQSVVAHGNSLFVLDPSNPMMRGVVGKAMLYEFDLDTNKLKRSWAFDKTVAPKKSYLNDLRVDDENHKIYITDSGLGGIVVLNLEDGSARRFLDNHPSTKAENVTLTVDRKKFTLNGKPARIHSDGIAFSPKQKRLYYHALTGYHLYSVPTEIFNGDARNPASDERVVDMGVTPAPDGMIFDEKGNLYMADLERNAVAYRTPAGQMNILIQDERIKWPDTFTLDNHNNLVFTDSLLQDAGIGKSVEGMKFSIYKVALPK